MPGFYGLEGVPDNPIYDSERPKKPLQPAASKGESGYQERVYQMAKRW